MRRSAKILLLALIVALLPLRSIAAMIADPCLAAEQQSAAQSKGHAQDSHTGSGKAHTHCLGSVFLTAAAPARLPARADEQGIAFVQRSAAAFVPDQLDPPPLALLR